MKKLICFGWLLTEYALAKPLLTFEKGEIVPAHAIRIEKSRPQELMIFLPMPKDTKVDESTRIKGILEGKLQSFVGLKIQAEKPDALKLQFQGPDTPLLQALSHIEVSP